MPIHHWREALNQLHDSVAGTNTGTGENRVMKVQNLSTSLGEGREAAPSLAHPSPETKPGRLHRSVDTPREINWVHCANTKVCLGVLSSCYFEERRNRILVHISGPRSFSSVYLLVSIVVLCRFLPVASEPNPKRIDKFANMNDTIISSEFF